MASSEIERERAESFFIFYSLMGFDRSLVSLHKYVTEMGLEISLTSLKRYSTKYGWAKRLQDIDASAESLAATQHVKDVEQMNVRQVKFGTALQKMGHEGLRQLVDRIPTMTFNDAGVLIERGVKVERLAMGEATDRRELTVQIVEPLVRQIVALFEQVNVLVDENARARQFAIGADSIIVDNFKELVS